MRILTTLLLWSIGVTGATAGLSVIAVREYKYGHILTQNTSCGDKDSAVPTAWATEPGCGVDLNTVAQWEELPHN